MPEKETPLIASATLFIAILRCSTGLSVRWYSQKPFITGTGGDLPGARNVSIVVFNRPYFSMKQLSFSATHTRLTHWLVMRIACCLWCVVAAMYAGPLLAQKKAIPATAAQKANPAFTYKIIPAANGTYGYDIYADRRLSIHQPSIPAMPGNEGFKTRATAEKVARLAIAKMKKGELPPTISPGELKKLGVM